MAITLDILSTLKAYIDAGYAASRGEKPALGVIADASGQEAFAAFVAEKQRKDSLLDRRLKQIEFAIEDAISEAETSSTMTISVVETFSSVMEMAGNEETNSGKNTHTFDLTSTGMGNWLICGHSFANGPRPDPKPNQKATAEPKTTQKKKPKSKKSARGWSFGASTGQLIILCFATIFLALFLIPYESRTEVCLETGAKRKSLKVAGISLRNKQIETEISTWIAQQGATPETCSWAIFEGREGRLFGQKIKASSRVTNALKILDKIQAKGDAGKVLLLEYQDIQQRRDRGKKIKTMNKEEALAAITDATAAGKEYLKFMQKLNR